MTNGQPTRFLGAPHYGAVVPPPTLGKTLWIVATVALITNALSLAAAQLWVYPDSIDYIVLGSHVADRFDFSNQAFLIRPIGYPLLLAGIFKLFGSASPIVVMIVQHTITIATVLVTCLIAWRLTTSRTITLVTGILGAFSLQALCYANLVLTETPFALALVASVYFLIVHLQDGRWRFLVLASAIAGISYLFRPIGLHLLGACALAAMLRTWRDIQDRKDHGLSVAPKYWLRRLAIGGTLAIVPAIAVTAPWSIKNALQHKSVESTSVLDYVLYVRAVTIDDLDSTTSETMIDIHHVVNEAIASGHLHPDADYRDRATVIKAYETIRGASYAESITILGRAAKDIMLENPLAITIDTIKYAYWMLLAPDPVYRFQPDAALGINGKKDVTATLYDVSTYSEGYGSWESVLKNHRHHLPLSAEPRLATPIARSVATQYHKLIDKGAPVFGLWDSRYEQWMIFIGLAGTMTMLTKRRSEWLLIAAVIAAHVLVSAFLSGPQTRYAQPVRPLLLMYAAFGLCLLASLVRAAWTAYATRHGEVAVSHHDTVENLASPEAAGS